MLSAQVASGIKNPEPFTKPSMSTSSAAAVTLRIPSVQTVPDGTPRFHVTVDRMAHEAESLGEREAAGGVDAEFRVFLDAQLEAGDVFLDLAPGDGFLALAAASVPGCRVRTIIVVDRVDDGIRIRGEAESVGRPIEVRLASMMDLPAMLSSVGDSARVFLRVTAARWVQLRASCKTHVEGGRIVALMIDAPVDAATMVQISADGFVPHVLAATEEDAVLQPIGGEAVPDPIIALYSAAVEVPAVSRPETGMPERVRNAPFHYIAPFCRTGYGVTGANMMRALMDLDADVAFVPLSQVDRSIASVPKLDAAIARAKTIDPAAPSVRMSQQFDLMTHVGTGPRIGFPIFELDRFHPVELEHLRAQDRLLVCSDWARTVIRGNGITDIPIDVVPLGVDRSVFHEHVPPASRSEDTVFMQIGKIEPRKGQLDLLRAFEAAFTPKDAVRLVLHCHNPFLKPDALATLVEPFRRSPMASRIELHLNPLPTQHDIARAMQRADCGVFCARAEGWNLEALEMLSVGKWIIATDYSAHTEFLTPQNALLVDIDRLEAQRVGHWAAFGARQQDQLVAHLRDVHTRRQEGPLVLNTAGITTATHFSWECAARQLQRAVDASVNG